MRGRPLLEQLALERGVFLDQRPLRDEVAADVGDRLARHLRHSLQWIEHERDGLPDVLEVAVARVEEEQRQRHEPEESEPRERRRPAMEERGRLDGDVAHRK